MPDILITLLVVLIVCAIVYWIITLLPFPPPIKNIILAIFGLIVLVWLLYAVFGGGDVGLHLHHAGPRRL